MCHDQSSSIYIELLEEEVEAYHWRCCCQQWGVVHQPLQWPQSPPASLQDCAEMTPAGLSLNDVSRIKGKGGRGKGRKGGHAQDKTIRHDDWTSPMSATRTCTVNTRLYLLYEQSVHLDLCPAD